MELLFLHFSETFTAVNRAVTTWCKRNFTFLTARSTYSIVIFTRCVLSFVTAFFASLWLVSEAFFCIKFLLSLIHIYKVLGIPEDLYTPIFAVARTAGWCAHRLEELTSGGKIIRPAYKSVSKRCV